VHKPLITYFEGDVSKVSNMLEREFEVDVANSLDKRDLLDPDRFGYLSRHYVLQLSQSRANLTEYSAFREYKAEVQVRSILQHAWAEIEHDLGYKSKIDVPRDIRRRFSRAAGMLELLDQEVAEIRSELDNYSNLVKESIATNPTSVEIDRDSLAAYIENSASASRTDAQLAEIVGGFPLRDYDPAKQTNFVALCNALGINKIQELDQNLTDDYGTMNALLAYLTENCCGRDAVCAPVCDPVAGHTSATPDATAA
jgi:hypothetical protein